MEEFVAPTQDATWNDLSQQIAPSQESAPAAWGMAVSAGENCDIPSKELNGSYIVFGRRATCDVVISHPAVSGEHCALVREPEGSDVVFLKDLSSNGTFLKDANTDQSSKKGHVVGRGKKELISHGQEFIIMRNKECKIAYKVLFNFGGNDAHIPFRAHTHTVEMTQTNKHTEEDEHEDIEEETKKSIRTKRKQATAATTAAPVAAAQLSGAAAVSKSHYQTRHNQLPQTASKQIEASPATTSSSAVLVDENARPSTATTNPAHNYDRRNFIANGTFASVYRAVHKYNGQTFAWKEIDKGRYNLLHRAADRPSPILDEVRILLRLQHPNIIRIYDCFESTRQLVLILELTNGKDLFERILSAGESGYAEQRAKKIMWQLADALKYLHSNQIVHRDLKPENILMVREDTDEIKLSDFGLSRILESSNNMTTFCGTPQYLAPEIIRSRQNDNSGYDKAVDIWSCGVILYVMLSGRLPFDVKKEGYEEDIKEGRYIIPRRYFGHVSDAALDLIRRMMCLSPVNRIKVDEIFHHRWFDDIRSQMRIYADDIAQQNTLNSKTIPQQIEEVKENCQSQAQLKSEKLRSPQPRAPTAASSTTNAQQSARTPITPTTSFLSTTPTPSPHSQTSEGSNGSTAATVNSTATVLEDESTREAQDAFSGMEEEKESRNDAMDEEKLTTQPQRRTSSRLASRKSKTNEHHEPVAALSAATASSSSLSSSAKETTSGLPPLLPQPSTGRSPFSPLQSPSQAANPLSSSSSSSSLSASAAAPRSPPPATRNGKRGRAAGPEVSSHPQSASQTNGNGKTSAEPIVVSPVDSKTKRLRSFIQPSMSQFFSAASASSSSSSSNLQKNRLTMLIDSDEIEEIDDFDSDKKQERNSVSMLYNGNDGSVAENGCLSDENSRSSAPPSTHSSPANTGAAHLSSRLPRSRRKNQRLNNYKPLALSTE